MIRRTLPATLFFACVGLAVLFAFTAEGKAADEWVPIFNGKNLDGWEAYGAKGKTPTEETWKVEDGVIHGSGPTSHLFSPRGDYKNFRERVEVKIADKGNSGQYFRAAKGPGFPKGYEAQINSTHGDPLRTGTLYGFVPVREMLVPPDTWFTQEVEAVGNHIIIKVNGKTVVDYVDPKNTLQGRLLRLPAARPQQPGLDPQGRSAGTALTSS